jgi:hypothetical protein
MKRWRSAESKHREVCSVWSKPSPVHRDYVGESGLDPNNANERIPWHPCWSNGFKTSLVSEIEARLEETVSQPRLNFSNGTKVGV